MKYTQHIEIVKLMGEDKYFQQKLLGSQSFQMGEGFKNFMKSWGR